MTVRNFLSSRFVRVTAVLLIVAVTIHLTLTAIALHHRNAVEREIAEQGLPLRPEQVIPHARAQDNSAHDYEKAFVLLSLDNEDFYNRDLGTTFSPQYQRIYDNVNRRMPRIKGSLPQADHWDPNEWTPAEREDAWKTLGQPEFMNIRSLLIEAGDKAQCVFAIDWESGPAMHLPMIQAMRQAVCLLAVHALLCHEHALDEMMMEDFRAALGAAYHSQQMPFLISNLVSTSEELITERAISHAMAMSGIGDTTPLERRLSCMEDRPLLATAFDAERVIFGGSIFRPTGKALPLPIASIYQGPLMMPLRLYEQAAYEHILEIASIAIRTGQYMPVVKLPPGAVISRMLMPALSMADQGMLRRLRARATMLTAFALEREHRQEGAYPQRLEDLVPKYLSAETIVQTQPSTYTLNGDSWLLEPAPIAAAGHPTPAETSHQLVWSSPRHVK